MPVSSVPNFRPDAGRRRCSYSGCSFRRAAGRRWRCFPCLTAHAPDCSIWSVPCTGRGSSPPVFHKSVEQKAAPAFCAIPVLAARAVRSLMGALSPGAARLFPSAVPVSVSASASRVCVPSPLRVPSPSPHLHRSGACVLCLATTLPADVDHPESQEVFG